MRVFAFLSLFFLSVSALAQSSDTTRGDTSIYQLLQRIKTQPGTSDPLVLLNDSVFKGDVHTIRSKDVESVDVLKGNDAEAIYGPAAKNGVFNIKAQKYLKADNVPIEPIVKFKDTSSTSKPTKPLILVDEIVYTGDLKNIDPNEIMTVEVVKGGHATARYGPRAAAGAIVIRTKKYTPPDTLKKTKRSDSTASNNALYVIDGVPSNNKLNGVDPKDILSVDILKKGKGSDASFEPVRDVVIVVTKAGAIKSYQNKFGAISKDYGTAIQSNNGNDGNYRYVIDNELVKGNQKDIIRTLYELPAKKIKKIVFHGAEPGDSTHEVKVFITTKK